MRDPEWYEPTHPLWVDFSNAMRSVTLSKSDWEAYKLAHDTQETPETQAELDRISQLLKD